MDIHHKCSFVVTVSLLSLIYYFQQHNQTDYGTNPLHEEHLQRTRNELERIMHLMSNKMEHEIIAEGDELQLQGESRVLHQKGALFLKHAFTEFSPDQIIIIPVIHIFGADFLSAISAVFWIIISTKWPVKLAFGYMIAKHIVTKTKSDIEELIRKKGGIKHDTLNTRSDRKRESVTGMEAMTEPKNQTDHLKDLPTEVDTLIKTELQTQTDGFKAVLAEAVSMQMEIKTEAENQRNRVRERLEEVERERESNEQRLQAVENEITEKAKAFEKPEKLVIDKENLLKDQWKLDKTKKDCKRQLLNLEKLLESIEGQIAWLYRKQEGEQV